VPLVGGGRAPPFITMDDAAPRFEPGVGVRLAPGEHSLAFAIARPATQARFLVADVDAPAGSRVRAYFTAGACPHFMEQCSVPLAEIAPGVFAADAAANPWWRHDIAALRLDVVPPAPATATVRGAGFVSQRAWRDRLAQQTTPLTLVAGDRPAPIVASGHLVVQPADGGGLAIALDHPKKGAPFAP
jgi:hypothetical protein